MILLVVPVGLILGGLVLVASGVFSGPPRPAAPALPGAKIDDGRPFPRRARRSLGIGRIIGGTLLAGCGGLLIAALYALRDAFSLKLGRPLRVHGRPRLARRARGTGSHDDARPCLDGLGAWRRARLGERWLAAARAEQASVPAFEHLGAQLETAGAPAALIERCRAAAADEVRHARRCYAFARAYSGIDWAAGALPAAGDLVIDLPGLAVESLLDGCVGEGIAADFARAGGVQEADPVVRESLAMIADDEAAHAELAWAVVAFCGERGGAVVRRALADQRLPDHVPSAGPFALARGERRRITEARLASVRARLASLVAGELGAA